MTEFPCVEDVKVSFVLVVEKLLEQKPLLALELCVCVCVCVYVPSFDFPLRFPVLMG